MLSLILNDTDTMHAFDHCIRSDHADELVRQHQQHFTLVDYCSLILALVDDQLAVTTAVLMKRTQIISSWLFAAPTCWLRVSAWVSVSSMLADVPP